MITLPRITVLGLACCMFLQGCTADHVALDGAAHRDLIVQDLQNLKPASGEALAVTLDLDAALARGVSFGLDARVSALEVLAKTEDVDLARLQAMPEFGFTHTYYGRSNVGASSSRSLLTGSQSLEPSYSSEQFRKTNELALNWKTLDILMAVAQSKIAKDEARIAKERHTKVIQNIEKDVYSAFWRAYFYQQAAADNTKLMKQARQVLDNVRKAHKEKYISKTKAAEISAPLLEAQDNLKKLDEEFSLAMLELKSLLALPNETKLKLKKPDMQAMRAIGAMLDEDIIALEREALMNRPEMREMVVQGDIDSQNIRNEIIKTLPGGELFFALNRDSNDFLTDNAWQSFSLAVAQNLSSLFTAPVRIRAAKNKKALGDLRRLSLSAAVLTQVQLAWHRLDYSKVQYVNNNSLRDVAAEQARAAGIRQAEGLLSKPEKVAAEMRAQIAALQAYQMQAEMQDAYAALLNTLGRRFRGAS